MRAGGGRGKSTYTEAGRTVPTAGIAPRFDVEQIEQKSFLW